MLYVVDFIGTLDGEHNLFSTRVDADSVEGAISKVKAAFTEEPGDTVESFENVWPSEPTVLTENDTYMLDAVNLTHVE